MKEKEDWEVLRDFYLYSDLNDERALDEYFAEKNIDLDAIAVELHEFLRSKKAEIMLAKGRKFKEDYLKTLGETKIAETEHEPVTSIGDYSFAYRKNGDGDEDIEDIKADEKKLDILKLLTEKNKQK